MIKRISHRQKTSRRGAAVVEFAICCPLLVMLIMGAIEASNFIHLQHVLTVASYEASLVVSNQGGTEANARSSAENVLDSYEVNGAQVTFNPAVDTQTPSGTWVTVTVTAPSNANALSPLAYFQGKTLRSVTTMMRL